MNTDEYSTEMELYGVSPSIIKMIMYTVTFLSPFGFIPVTTDFAWFFFFSGIYGFFWIFVNPFVYLPLCLLNILYAHQIVKYYQGRSSRNSVNMIGLLSILLPTVIVLLISGILGGYIVLYPIPIQFLIGFVLMWRIDGPEVISPWSGMRLDLSWWKFGKPRKTTDWDPLEQEKKKAKHEDWLEE